MTVSGPDAKPQESAVRLGASCRTLTQPLRNRCSLTHGQEGGGTRWREEGTGRKGLTLKSPGLKPCDLCAGGVRSVDLTLFGAPARRLRSSSGARAKGLLVNISFSSNLGRFSLLYGSLGEALWMSFSSE